MDLTEKIEQVADRVKDQKDFIEGGEPTKSTFVVPFIEALGYDTYDPNEVTPDFSVASQGGRRETMDYTLLSGGTPAILIVCKPAGRGRSSPRRRLPPSSGHCSRRRPGSES